MRDNYAIAQDYARQLFLNWDQEALIARCGLKADGDFIHIDFLGQPFSIRRDSGAVENRAQGRAAKFNEALSIYDYICRREPLPMATGEFLSTNSLKGVPKASPSSATLHQKWADRFQNSLPALQTALSRIGTSPFPQGDAACVFPLFDGLSAVFQFWEGDDEFPPSVRFLWDAITPDCLKYETLYYVMSCFLNLLDEAVSELEKNP